VKAKKRGNNVARRAFTNAKKVIGHPMWFRSRDVLSVSTEKSERGETFGKENETLSETEDVKG